MDRRPWLHLGIGFALVTGVLQAQGPDQWYRDGRAAVERAKQLTPITGKAKNVILFLGDGMGVTTVTAARILEGQRRGQSGEENLLFFETLPYTALIKTYSTNEQVPDSAGTMTAIVTGVKTKSGVLSVNENVTVGDYASAKGNEVTTILELAERAGLSTGVVSTTRITHATPAACYAHTPDRDWESDARTPKEALDHGFGDIARQLVEFNAGNGLEVALGGGRDAFLPGESPRPGLGRKDGRDLTAAWLEKPNSRYVTNREQLNAVDPATTGHLLGLFSPDHMAYECDRGGDKTDEPSLTEMTVKAIELLSKNPKGFFLMIEGGRIDHGHHAGNAHRALMDTIEFAGAVRAAAEKIDRKETLVIVTADHSHVLTMGGYPTRGNPILGKVVQNDKRGNPEKPPAKDKLGLPFTTLGYANGPGYTGASAEQKEGSKKTPHYGRRYQGIASGRPDLSEVDTTEAGYMQEATVPLSSETHGGEDVPVYADGPQAHLFHGVLEQNVIFHVMVEALGLKGAEAP